MDTDLLVVYNKRSCVYCVCDSEEREHGVGDGVNDTMLSTRKRFV